MCARPARGPASIRVRNQTVDRRKIYILYVLRVSFLHVPAAQILQSCVICTQACSFTRQSRVPFKDDGSHGDVARRMSAKVGGLQAFI